MPGGHADRFCGRHILRSLIIAFALAAAPAAAFADSTATQTALHAPTALESSRAMLEALLVESGVIDAAVMTGFNQAMPGFRETIIAPLLAEFTPDQRIEMEAFIATLPERARARVAAATPAILDDAATRAAGRFTQSEMEAISEFLSREEVRPLLLRLITSGANNLTAAERRTARDWGRTPAGRAFVRESDALMGILNISMQRAQHTITDGLVQDVFAAVCHVMGEDCPAEFSAAAAGAL